MDAEKPHSLTEPPSVQAKSEQSTVAKFKRHFLAEVSKDHADVLFIACCFISGLVDSSVYRAYGTFVSMQTGNTIFLGLGGATPHSTASPYRWSKSLLSIGTFFAGCFFFSTLSRTFSPLRRATLTTSFLLQTIIILVTAAIVQAGVINGRLDSIPNDIDWWQLLPIGLLSFQSAGQIVGSRALALAEIPTVVLTSMLHDIATDPSILQPQNIKRNRRVLAFFGILVGAIVGGFVSEGTGRMHVALWIAGGIKFGITVAWVVWPELKGDVV